MPDLLAALRELAKAKDWQRWNDTRLVYADQLEEEGRWQEAFVARGDWKFLQANCWIRRAPTWHWLDEEGSLRRSRTTVRIKADVWRIATPPLRGAIVPGMVNVEDVLHFGPRSLIVTHFEPALEKNWLMLAHRPWRLFQDAEEAQKMYLRLPLEDLAELIGGVCGVNDA